MNVAFVMKSSLTEIASCGSQDCNTSTEELVTSTSPGIFGMVTIFPSRKLPDVVEFLVGKQSLAMEL